MGEFLTWNAMHVEQMKLWDWMMLPCAILLLLSIPYAMIKIVAGIVGWVIRRFFTVRISDYWEDSF